MAGEAEMAWCQTSLGRWGWVIVIAIIVILGGCALAIYSVDDKAAVELGEDVLVPVLVDQRLEEGRLTVVIVVGEEPGSDGKRWTATVFLVRPK